MKSFNDLKNFTNEKSIRIFTIILSSFLFSNVLPITIFIVYMKQNNFFSYDFFISGLFGLSTFFFFIVLFVATLTLFTTSSFFFLIEILIKIVQRKYIQKKKVLLYIKHHFKQKTLEAKFIFIIFLIINILFALITFIAKEEVHSFTPFIYIINFLIVTHITIVFFTKALHGIISLLFFFSAIIYIGFSQPENTVSLVKYGLNLFGSGAKEVEAKFLNENNKTIKGTMLLLSPENIYIQNIENNITSMKIIKRDNIVIDIKN